MKSALLLRLTALRLKPAVMAEVCSIINEIEAPIEMRKAKDRGRKPRKIRGNSTENPRTVHGNSTPVSTEIPLPVSLQPSKNNKDSLNGNDSSFLLSSSEVHLEKKEGLEVARARAEIWTTKFIEFWNIYPKRRGNNPKHPASLKFLALVKSGVDPDAIVAGARNYATDPATEAGTPYVKQAVVWLNQRGWEDYASKQKTTDEPAYMKPPPGCQPYEDFRRQYDAAKNENTLREDTGVGEEGADYPEELQLSS